MALWRIRLQCRRPLFDSWVRKIHWRRDRLPTPVFLGFPGGLVSKESTCNAGDLGSILGLGRSPVEGIGYPHSSILRPRVPKSWTQLSDFHFHFQLIIHRRDFKDISDYISDFSMGLERHFQWKPPEVLGYWFYLPFFLSNKSHFQETFKFYFYFMKLRLSSTNQGNSNNTNTFLWFKVLKNTSMWLWQSPAIPFLLVLLLHYQK